MTHPLARVMAASERRLAMHDTCTVQRASETSDGMGGTTTTWADHITGLACREENRTSVGESLEGGQIVAEADVVLVVPEDTDVTAKDRVVKDGRTMAVEGVLEATYSPNLKVFCRQST